MEDIILTTTWVNLNTGMQEILTTLMSSEGSWSLKLFNSLPLISGAEWNSSFYIIVGIWLLCIIWIIKDSSYRSKHTSFVILSILLISILTPVIGLPIYRAIRPKWYKYERAYRKTVMTDGFEKEVVYNEASQVSTFRSDDENTDSDEFHITQIKANITPKPEKTQKKKKKDKKKKDKKKE